MNDEIRAHMELVNELAKKQLGACAKAWNVPEWRAIENSAIALQAEQGELKSCSYSTPLQISVHPLSNPPMNVIEQAIEALGSINIGYRSRAGIAREVCFDESKCNAALTALRSLLTPSPLQDDIVSYTWPRKACPCGDAMGDACIQNGCTWENDPSLVPTHLRSMRPITNPVQTQQSTLTTHLEQIYEYLYSAAPEGFADEAFRNVPETLLAYSTRHRVSKQRFALGYLPSTISGHVKSSASTDKRNGTTVNTETPPTHSELECSTSSTNKHKVSAQVLVRLALEAGFCCDATFGVFYIDHREGVCTNEIRRFADLLVSAMNDPAQSQTQPQTIVTDRKPHPNAFMQVPQGTEITAHWPSMVEPQQQNTVTDEWLDTQRADVGTGIHRDLYNRIVRHALRAVSLSGKADNKLNDEQPRLTVRITSYPESNGKRNWTAMIARIDSWGGLVGNCGGITIDRGELWNRVAYSAECARFLLGERDTEPHILDYGTDMETPDNWPGETRTKSPRSPIVICNFGLNPESFSRLALENMITSGTKEMFQDAEGTIPLTAVGQPVGLVKSTQKYEPSSQQSEPSKMPIFSYKPKDETE
jgi:hypothetical protein